MPTYTGQVTMVVSEKETGKTTTKTVNVEYYSGMTRPDQNKLFQKVIKRSLVS